MISVYTVGKGYFILSIIRRCGILKEEKLLHVDQIHIEIRIIQVEIHIIHTLPEGDGIQIIRADVGHGIDLKIKAAERDAP